MSLFTPSIRRIDDAELCRRIETYWRERGLPKIKAWVQSCREPEMIDGKGGSEYVVRTTISSNLDGRGWPPV